MKSIQRKNYTLKMLLLIVFFFFFFQISNLTSLSNLCPHLIEVIYFIPVFEQNLYGFTVAIFSCQM